MKLAHPSVPNHYYDFGPPNGHRTGDIWAGLPSFGLVATPQCRGLLITPRCDLSHDKTDVLTFLPILSCDLYLRRLQHLPTIWAAMCSSLQPLSITPPPVDLAQANLSVAPHLPAIRTSLADVSDKGSQKEIIARDRALAALNYVESMNTGKPTTVTLEQVLPPREWTQTSARIVTNAYRPDVHFLPADGQNERWSAVPQHSLCLFRSPISLPARCLTEAQLALDVDWETTCDGLTSEVPAATYLRAARPIKLATLRLEFLSDILTRFVGLYGRLGSADFTDDTVSRYCAALSVPTV